MKEKAKKFGLFTAILITINGILGSGVFQLPRNLYIQMAGNFWISIIISSVGAALLSFGFAFLAKLINNRNGGKYLYTKIAFGNRIGGWVGLVNVLAMFIVNAGCVNGFLKVANQYGVSAGGTDWYNASGSWYWLKVGAVVGIVLTISFMLLKGLKTSKIANNTITIMKLLPLILFVIIGLAFMKHTGNFSNSLSDIKTIAKTDPGLVSQGVSSDIYQPIIGGITGIVTIFYAFLGFDSIGNSISVFKNPSKTVPLALGATMFFLTIIYIVVFVGTVGTLPVEILLKKGMNPIAEAVRLTPLGDSGYHLIMIGQLFSTAGITFIAIFYTPYMFGAMARDGLLPPQFRAKNKNGSYTYGIILTAIGTTILGLFKFSFLVQINVLTRFIIFDMTMIALLIIIKRNKLANTWKLKTAKGFIMGAIGFCSAILLMKVLPFEALANGEFTKEAFKPVTDGITSIGLSAILFVIAWFYQWKFAEMKENKKYRKIMLFIKNDLQGELDNTKIKNYSNETLLKTTKSIFKKHLPSYEYEILNINNIYFNEDENEVTYSAKLIFPTKTKKVKENIAWMRIKM